MDVVALTAVLARIDSTNSTLVPGGAGEAEIAAYVGSWMRSRGWQVTERHVAAGRPNVVARIPGGNGPTLLINGHLDTVGAGAATRVVRLEGDRLHGRGVLDTKGGLAAALIAGATLSKAPPGDIVIAAVCDEEDASIGTQALLADCTADASIVLEPTDLTVGVRHRGSAVLEASFTGRAAHTAYRDSGRNAIDAAFRMATRLADLDRGFSGRSASSAEELPTVQVTQIHGGTEVFTVPDHCMAIVEMRTVAPTADVDLAAVHKEIKNDSADGIAVDLTVLQVRPPLMTLDPATVSTLLSEATVAVGGSGERVALPFWTDAALQAEASIPSVVFGPGGDGIHSEDEFVLTGDLEKCRDSLRLVMSRFGGAPGSLSGA
jgi:acetylornithine deacetylase